MENSLLSVEMLALERDDRLLFQAFDWQAFAGELWQLTGPNGAGKTSLLKVLAGLLSGYEGKLEWQLGKDDMREELGYIGHQTGLRDELTATENLQWLASLHGEPVSGLQDVLVKLGLRGYTDVPLAHLSAGQKRRAALSRLWLSHKKVWLLDEPFTAIDAKGVELLSSRLVELANAGALVIYTSHHRVNAQAKRIELAQGRIRVTA